MKLGVLSLLLGLLLSACQTSQNLAIQAPALTVDEARRRVSFCDVNGPEDFAPVKGDPRRTVSQKAGFSAKGAYLCSWGAEP